MIVAVVDDWDRRDAGENGGVVPADVYQPSVADKRAYKPGIYTESRPRCSRDTLPLFLFHSLLQQRHRAAL